MLELRLMARTLARDSGYSGRGETDSEEGGEVDVVDRRLYRSGIGEVAK